MSQATPIEMKSLFLRFGDNEVLRDFSMRVGEGEALAILGPSGSGKSSLLKLCSGLLLPSSGEVCVNGASWDALQPAELAERRTRMGMLFQKNALFDSMTCIDNVAFPLRLRSKLTESEVIQKSENYLERVGLAHARDLMPSEISGGMQKRLGIARALALDPKIVLYDDPTAGLDPITSRKIVDLILELKTRNQATILVVTNDVQRALQISKKILIVFSPTKILEFGSHEEFLGSNDEDVRQFILSPLESQAKRNLDA